MTELLTIGEPLVLFASLDDEKSIAESKNFYKYIAGAEVNVAIGTSRLGHSVEYLSAVGADPMGQFVLNELARNQIVEKNISVNSNFPTGIMFKAKTSIGDPATFYLRKNSAASKMSLAISKIDVPRFLHLTGVYLALSREARNNVNKLLNSPKLKETTIFFDPNIRPALWESEELMVSTINSVAFKSNIFLPGIKEAQKLTGLETTNDISNYYFTNSPDMSAVIFKLGAQGAEIHYRNGEVTLVPGFKAEKVIDTVGAGDGFAVGVITALLEDCSLKDAVVRANAIGAMAVQSPGDSTGYPTDTELNAFLSYYGDMV